MVVGEIIAVPLHLI